MDEPKKEQISIKINGKEKFALTEQELNEEIAAAKEIDSEQSPPFLVIDSFDEVTSTKVIDFEEHRNKRNNRLNSDRPHSFYEAKRHLQLKKKNLRSPFINRNRVVHSIIKKIIVALVLAISIGIGLGYTVLSFFTDISSSSNKDTNNIGQTGEMSKTISGSEDQSIPAITVPIEYKTKKAEEKTTNSSVADLPQQKIPTEIAPLQVQVVQGGAFSSLEAANQYASKLKNSGQAAILVSDSNPILMFIGMGTNKNEVSIIRDYYQEMGQEVYIKTIDTRKVETGSMNQQIALYMATGQALYQSLITRSTLAIESNDIDRNEWNTLQLQFAEWNKLKPAKIPASVQVFSQSITTAFQALAKYETNNNEQQLWKSQQALLQGLLAYQKWVDETN